MIAVCVALGLFAGFAVLVGGAIGYALGYEACRQDAAGSWRGAA